jgi:transcriptional regulator with XRE-family HTH domain
MTPNELWASRQECSEEARREFERERLMMWTLDALADIMQETGITKADLARKLGTSRAHVTQVFSGSRNATLSTVSDLAWACGKRAVVKFEPLRSGQFISHPVNLQSSLKPRVVVLAPKQAEKTDTGTKKTAGAL